MKWIIYSLSILMVGGGIFVGSSTASSQQERSQTEAPEPKDEDFIPTEKVPADSAISFPVDI